ncbi:hypothetical protein FDP08_14125 [Marinobacter panjinensis]|uniref:Uncharacterized protein n=1 Tax=Marinobacter panjinensis TaxID=2576384 RepID=A0A4U6R650_9GAMM|nr:hypothetical protein [Marinobacter panjinensis]TKV69149.1 hypothetical protein FDP08_14125 [Marinobacter panjinensis]
MALLVPSAGAPAPVNSALCNQRSHIPMEIEDLKSIRDQHDIFGKKLFAICDGNLFPANALYLSILNRSLEIFDGFVLLAEHGNYSCCMAMLRMQLDNVMRFYGILITKDPHATANLVLNGTHLCRLSDVKGKKLTDTYLTKRLGAQNDWVGRVYKLTSGYVHLSDQHFYHFLGRSKASDQAERHYYLSSNDSHVDPVHKEQLVQAFKVTTVGIFELFYEWEKISRKYNPDTLFQEYASNA